MPKGFTEREKELIRASLLEKGKALFATYGIKKTNVEDLTRAAGISKGAFYLFYDSKEELFFELLEQFEADFKANILKAIARPGTSPRQRFKDMLKEALSAWKTNALFTQFSKEEYAQLLRKLPVERVQAHTLNDESSAAELIDQWRSQGVAISDDSKMVANLMKALFFLSLHEDEFGKDVYPRVMEVLINLIAGYLIQESVTAP